MKALLKSEILGGTIFFVGLFIAVCTVDGSPNEMLLRLVGLAVCIIGAIIAKFAPEAHEGDEREEERKVDHEPYPEE